MRQKWLRTIAAGIFLLAATWLQQRPAQARPQSTGLTLHSMRMSPDDLEIGGDLAGLPPGSTRYLTREDLLTLPQVDATETGDANFTGATEISGVPLEELAQRLGAAPQSEAVIAICTDKYRSHYTRAYLAAHHPLLVLQVNARPPARWPKDPDGNDMGPYLISHAHFTPSFKILSHADEAQIPWGVVRLEFRDEHAVFAAITPQGPQASDPAVQAGFTIAQQNCFRCHNMGDEGGQKAKISWTALAKLAETKPQFFAAYVRKPQAENPHTQMAASPNYNDATLAALEAYFKTFAPK